MQVERTPKTHRFVRTIITFHLIVFSFIFFSANDLNHALTLIENMFDVNSPLRSFYSMKRIITRGDFVYGLLGILLMEFVHVIQLRHDINKLFAKKNIILRWSVYFFLIVSILVFGEYRDEQFIYFQF